MKKVIIAAALSILLIPYTSMAATIQELWNKDTTILAKFAVDNSNHQTVNASTQLYMGPQNGSAANQLRLLKASADIKNNSHARYNQYYQGIPVWGMQAIYHSGTATQQNESPALTGTLLQNINKDVPTIKPKFSAADIAKHAQQLFLKTQPGNGNPKMFNTKLVIYANKIHNNYVAKLAYTVTFFVKTTSKHMKPFYIIDANTKQVLSYWDDLRRDDMGQGPGGNISSYALHQNHFQYGNALTSLPSLGKLPVTVDGANCTTSNAYVKISSFGTVTIPDPTTFFPISVNDEVTYPTFSYACSAGSAYVNNDDAGYAPVNGGYSPINDSLYFATKTYEMFQDHYHLSAPFGTDLPIRFNTHVDAGNLDNAFAMSAQRDDDGHLISHQQITIGNGATESYPLSQGTLGHEMGHLFTALNSDLIYANQSGGMNEAFSDMSDLAMRVYIQSLYPWYTYDYNIGAEEKKNAQPLRCMDNPSCDGNSIANAHDYFEGMDVHYSSGVYNKAFYLLSTTAGWTIDMAFSIMLDANKFFWTPNSTYNSGCLGVTQAAYNRGYKTKDVLTAFRNVGISCKF